MKRKLDSNKNHTTMSDEEFRLYEIKMKRFAELGIGIVLDDYDTEEIEKLKNEIFGSTINYLMAETQAESYINNNMEVPMELKAKLLEFKHRKEILENKNIGE